MQCPSSRLWLREYADLDGTREVTRLGHDRADSGIAHVHTCVAPKNPRLIHLHTISAYGPAYNRSPPDVPGYDALVAAYAASGHLSTSMRGHLGLARSRTLNWRRPGSCSDLDGPGRDGARIARCDGADLHLYTLAEHVRSLPGQYRINQTRPCSRVMHTGRLASTSRPTLLQAALSVTTSTKWQRAEHHDTVGIPNLDLRQPCAQSASICARTAGGWEAIWVPNPQFRPLQHRRRLSSEFRFGAVARARRDDPGHGSRPDPREHRRAGVLTTA